ncbi:hypothetical protein [Prosthecobacter sp.]|uniref:hypothetical protein n=1 Tax=Prosthecobacter sp. TaxID=1965333 RepID=UPI00378466CC
MLLPAGLAGGGLASHDEQILDQLRCLQLVELLDADAEELLGQIFRHMLGDAGVFVDDAQDEPALTVGAVPAVCAGMCWWATVVVDRMGASLGLRSRSAVAIGFSRQNVARLLDVLIDRLLQELVKLLHFASTWVMSLNSTSTETLKLWLLYWGSPSFLL